MADNARGIHVSPGIYSKETDITYAVKSLGITTLGLAGETLRGPAFQPMLIENWRDFQSMFGGTSTEKFKGSQYPKYELPYIAKSYLKESNQLQVCRVLGLSGYNAGPAWVITSPVTVQTRDEEGEISTETKNIPIAVLRSRGYYEMYHKYGSSTGNCDCPQETYDQLFYTVGEWSEDSYNCSAPKTYNGGAVCLSYYTKYDSYGNECIDYKPNGQKGNFDVSPTNPGQFKICGVKGFQKKQEGEFKIFASESKKSDYINEQDYFEYPVSLNPGAKDYILKVLGTNPHDGDAPLYVEALYDVMLNQMIEADEIKTINGELTFYQVYNVSDYDALQSVSSIIDKQEEALVRKDVGKRLLADKASVNNHVHCHPYDYKTNKPLKWEVVDSDAEYSKPYICTVSDSVYTFKKYNTQTSAYTQVTTATTGIYDLAANSLVMEDVVLGQIYTVAQYTDGAGKRHYYYKYYSDSTYGIEDFRDETNVVDYTSFAMTADKLSVSFNADGSAPESGMLNGVVLNNSDNRYYRLNSDGDDVDAVTCDMNNYKDSYRFASTPWIVSNIKGDYDTIELTKLFRFHTISDGDSSNKEIKISIQNIKTEEGTFEVVVRDINDTDESPIVLERFTKCTMVPGDNGYISYKIGSYDGLYESKSKYITVEVNETLAAQNSVPAGFLGYPLSDFAGLQVYGDATKDMTNPRIKYNLYYDQDVKNRKQYFGLSNRVGVDIDMFTYKGQVAYGNEPEYLSQGFHLDSRLDTSASEYNPRVLVDGESGYTFDAVSINNRTVTLAESPIISTEADMTGSIYENVDLRKFTLYFYGGFDGWDIYRDYRSNTDDFKLSKYRGDYNDANGEGLSFNKIMNPEALGLNQVGMTSDWYAYLAGIRQFANPEAVDINVFATPGIDIINNKTLVEEAIEMIEEERADSIYVVTMPDKPFGASDYVDEMYTPDDVVYELEDSEIDSNYTCTYYPWVKYEDTDNNQYIYLPPTKDVVRNMALTDNTTHPWFAPAGISRGDVECARAHIVTKLDDEDVLYEGRINPIKTFASDGVKIWGQKNLQIRESQLNRIAVRRLLLRMRKLIAISCIGLIFDPNDTTTKNKFLSTVTPIMDNIKSNRGISDYKIEVNDTVESRERRELPAKIFFKPYNALEYIVLDFIVTPESVSFDDI